jgi:hypothetical protein
MGFCVTPKNKNMKKMMQDEARAEGIRDYDMEYWAMESERGMNESQREAELEAMRMASSEKECGLER